jgi:glutathione S-transferase
MTENILTIRSKNYSSWSLRGWLLDRMAGLKSVEEVVRADDPSNRAELLLLSPSILVPRLTHRSIRIWETLLIAEYLNEVRPRQGCCRRIAPPAPAVARFAWKCTRDARNCDRPSR